MSWHESSPYSQSPDILARWSTAMERERAAQRRRHERICKAVIAVSIAVLAICLAWSAQ
jgi:hypothetical protein